VGLTGRTPSEVVEGEDKISEEVAGAAEAPASGTEQVVVVEGVEEEAEEEAEKTRLFIRQSSSAAVNGKDMWVS